MESFMFSDEKLNRCRKKVIPWHVHQRYMASLSQLSLNQTISAAIYKKKIKSLQRNNRHLALSLQQSRYHATDKENLLIDNGKILDIINFSRVKLMDMAINMKQATNCLDETLLLLNSSLSENLSKHSSNNLNYRNDFKNKLQELNRNSPIEEVSENSDKQKRHVQSRSQKGKISRVDGFDSSPNKKCKLTKKGRAVKTNCKDVPKFAEESKSVTPISSKKTSMKDSKKCDSALNSRSRKKSLPKRFNTESASSKSSSSTSSKHLLQAKTKQESLNKKRKAVKVILADIAETFLTQETENYHSVKNESFSTSHNTDFKCFMPNSPEDDMLIKKYLSSELTYKQKKLDSNSYNSQFATIDEAGIPNCSQNTSDSSNFSHKNLSCVIQGIDEKSPTLSPVKKGDFVHEKNSALMKVKPKENENIAKQNNENNIKKVDPEKDIRSYKSHNSKLTKRVSFYFDEDAIEKVDGNSVASKDRIRKAINKGKARKTVSHKKKNDPSKITALKSNVILPDNVSKLGKNSFLVTAEVHSPPNDIYVHEVKNKICFSERMVPHVVLTDIFKSNRGLLSEMVGNGLQENECFQKTIKTYAVTPLTEMNTTYEENKNPSANTINLNAANMDCENTENRCLPEDREIIEQGKQRRRNNIVSYKEPRLNVKMRRFF